MAKVVLEKTSNAKESLENVYKDGCNTESTIAESKPAPKLSPTSVPAKVTVAVMPGETDASQAKTTPKPNEPNDTKNVARAKQSEAVTKANRTSSVDFQNDSAGTGIITVRHGSVTAIRG